MKNNCEMIKQLKLIGQASLLIFMAACSPDNKETHAKTEPTDSVNVFIVKEKQVRKKIILPGELLPFEKVGIHSRADGYIQKLNVDIGSVVKKGTVLAVIEAPETESAVAEAHEKMQSAKANYLTSVDTYKRLLRASKVPGAIAEGELEQAKNKLAADSTHYRAATYAAESFVKINNYLAVVAPFSGVVTKINSFQGTLVGKDNVPILEIENNSKLRLRVAVPEAASGGVLLNDSILFTVKAYPGKKYKAKLVRKAGSIDVQTRSEQWEFEINNEKRKLKSGMFADVQLILTRQEPSLIVPNSAVCTTLENKFVIKLSNSETKWINITQGFNLYDSAEIFGDLNFNDTLALNGTDELKPGKVVAPRLKKK